MEQGTVRGLIKAVLLVLTRRFGAPPRSLKARLARLPAPQLERLLEATVTVPSLAAFEDQLRDASASTAPAD